MSITLPHHLVEVMDFLGFNWPELDEDEIRRGADLVKQFAKDAAGHIETQHGIVTNDVRAVYTSADYETLALQWTSQTKQHLDELVTCCGVLADGLEVAAAGVEVMKGKVIAQLTLAVGEFIADQAASVFTLGLAEAALPLLYEAQNKILGFIMNEFEQKIMSEVFNAVLTPVAQRIEAAVDRLVYREASTVVAGSGRVKVDTTALRAHAAAIRSSTDDAVSAGSSYASTAAGLQVGR